MDARFLPVKPPVALIATYAERYSLLLGRSVPSVLGQSLKPQAIVIVDDNDNLSFPSSIRKQIAAWCNASEIKCHIIKNRRTRHMSGSGAWNTGIHFIAEEYGIESFVAILDDDDEWRSNHLSLCFQSYRDNHCVNAVFPWLRRTDCAKAHRFSLKDLTVDEFLVGNPGVQGSNMLFRVSTLLALDGFDERLASCTDRDLLIRYIGTWGVSGIRVIKRVTVKHYAASGTVTTNLCAKAAGLDRFYEKHLRKYVASCILERSLDRAVKLFRYPNASWVRSMFSREAVLVGNEEIAVGVAMHNNADSIAECLDSIFSQSSLRRRLRVILFDDASTDDSIAAASKYFGREGLVVLSGNNHNTAKTRNAINRYILNNCKDVVLIGRLDADDVFADETVLARLEKAFDQSNGVSYVLAGNLQRTRSGRILRRANRATWRLLDLSHLAFRLKRMVNGKTGAELPSCNLFCIPKACLRYPNLDSAEDHALLVDCLCEAKDNNRVYVVEDLLLSIYTLGGRATTINRKKETYFSVRRDLLRKVENLI